ncbi:nucleotidyltransferase domain-containing protein [bacterium]|nr:nucleotidyltransferase domain-containing protein [bacterium]
MFSDEQVIAIGVTGSYANNSYKNISDVDIVCVTTNMSLSEEIIIRDKYYVINIINQDYLSNLFNQTSLHVSEIVGFSYMVTIYEKEKGFLDKFINNAKDIVKNLEYERTSAQDEFISWLEEVQKAITGYKSNNVNKMLQGIHGLTFGMFNTLKYYFNIILIFDNEYFDKIISYNNFTKNLLNTSLLAFGLIEVSGIKERIENGFILFKAVSTLIYKRLSKTEQKYLDLLISEIEKIL